MPNTNEQRELAVIELVDKLQEVYDDLYPVGEHDHHQWSSASAYLEWFADILVDFFGEPPVDSEGYYIERTRTP